MSEAVQLQAPQSPGRFGATHFPVRPARHQATGAAVRHAAPRRLQRQPVQAGVHRHSQPLGGLLANGSSGIYVNLAAGLFILPFFLFSATAGTLADTYEKSRLIRFVKLGEIVVAALAGIALYAQSMPALFAVLFLLGVQSTFFGPLKVRDPPTAPRCLGTGRGNAVVQMGHSSRFCSALLPVGLSVA